MKRPTRCDPTTHYRQIVERHEKKVARRQSALRAFNALGGVETFTDAKAEWEDDEDYDY